MAHAREYDVRRVYGVFNKGKKRKMLNKLKWFAALAALAIGCAADDREGETTIDDREGETTVDGSDAIAEPEGHLDQVVRVTYYDHANPSAIREEIRIRLGNEKSMADVGPQWEIRDQGTHRLAACDPDAHGSQCNTLEAPQVDKACTGTPYVCQPCDHGVGCLLPDDHKVSWCNGGYFWEGRLEPGMPNHPAGGGAGNGLGVYFYHGTQLAVNEAPWNWRDTRYSPAQGGGLFDNNRWEQSGVPLVTGTSGCGGWSYGTFNFPGGSVTQSYPRSALKRPDGTQYFPKPRANDMIFFRADLSAAPANSEFSDCFAAPGSTAIGCTISFVIARGSWDNTWGTFPYSVHVGAAILMDPPAQERWRRANGISAANRDMYEHYHACHEIGHFVGLVHPTGADDQDTCMTRLGLTNTAIHPSAFSFREWQEMQYPADNLNSILVHPPWPNREY